MKNQNQTIIIVIGLILLIVFMSKPQLQQNVTETKPTESLKASMQIVDNGDGSVTVISEPAIGENRIPFPFSLFAINYNTCAYMSCGGECLDCGFPPKASCCGPNSKHLFGCGSSCVKTCTPSCTCASTTCKGSTCSDGCGGTCSGTKTCGGGGGGGGYNPPPEPEKYCGDGSCNNGEDCDSCSSDCGDCDWCQDGFCCDDHSHIPCGDTRTCGSVAYCNNLLNNKDKSCWNGICCNNNGDVIDATCIDSGSNICCCTPSSPFLSSDFKGCYASYQPGSNNIYTRQSSCFPPQTSCEGFSHKECTISGFVYSLTDKGPIVGKCGVECIGEGSCKENDLHFYECNNYKLAQSTVQIGKCGVECYETEQPKCDGFDTIQCIEGKWKNIGKIAHMCNVECGEDITSSCKDYNFLLCQNNQFVSQGKFLGKCGVECFKDSDCAVDNSYSKFTCNNKNQLVSKFISTRCDNSTYTCKESTKELLIKDCSPNSCYDGNCLTYEINNTVVPAEDKTPSVLDTYGVNGSIIVVIVGTILLVFFLRRKK